MVRIVRAVVLAAMLPLLGACDRASPAVAGSAGSSALAPAATISAADDNKTVQLRVGQVVDVALQADNGMDDWQVEDPDPAILVPTVNPAAGAAKGATLRAYKAIGAGTAIITATGRPSCNPGQVCSRLIRAFKATVVVSA